MVWWYSIHFNVEYFGRSRQCGMHKTNAHGQHMSMVRYQLRITCNFLMVKIAKYCGRKPCWNFDQLVVSIVFGASQYWCNYYSISLDWLLLKIPVANYLEQIIVSSVTRSFLSVNGWQHQIHTHAHITARERMWSVKDGSNNIPMDARCFSNSSFASSTSPMVVSRILLNFFTYWERDKRGRRQKGEERGRRQEKGVREEERWTEEIEEKYRMKIGKIPLLSQAVQMLFHTTPSVLPLSQDPAWYEDSLVLYKKREHKQTEVK